jgi:Xaa-Pro aminopeptidase
MDKAQELGLKRERIGSYLTENGLDGVVLARSDNFAWLGCGAENVVNSAQETGVGALVATHDRVALVANNIETKRLTTEELDGLEIADTIVFPWYEPSRRDAVIADLCSSGRFAADDGSAGLPPLPGGFTALRFSLTEAEVARYRVLARDAGDAMEAAGRAVTKGMTESEVAGVVADECWKKHIFAPVLLVAADERIRNWRHPIVKETPVEQYVMMVICGRRGGLIAAVTRLVHFGEMPGALRERHRAVCEVDAAMILATRPGRPAAAVFAAAQRAYTATGHDGEWQLHHQGGAIGYQPREYIATPECSETVQARQAFAWNPSIRGTKSEDTVLVDEDGFEILSAPSAEWPAIEVEQDGEVVRRADILVK